jgi:hypothetical protein
MGNILRRSLVLLCLLVALSVPVQAIPPPHAPNRAPVTVGGLLNRLAAFVTDLLKERGGFDPDGLTAPTPPPPRPPTTEERGGLDPDG